CRADGGQGRALSAGAAAMLRVWDLGQDRQHNANPAAAFTLGVPVECVACAPDGSRAAAGGRGGLLRLYHLAASPPRPAGELRGHGGTVRCAAFASERLLVSGDSDGAVLVWRPPAPPREGDTGTP